MRFPVRKQKSGSKIQKLSTSTNKDRVSKAWPVLRIVSISKPLKNKSQFVINWENYWEHGTNILIARSFILFEQRAKKRYNQSARACRKITKSQAVPNLCRWIFRSEGTLEKSNNFCPILLLKLFCLLATSQPFISSWELNQSRKLSRDSTNQHSFHEGSSEIMIWLFDVIIWLRKLQAKKPEARQICSFPCFDSETPERELWPALGIEKKTWNAGKTFKQGSCLESKPRIWNVSSCCIWGNQSPEQFEVVDVRHFQRNSNQVFKHIAQNLYYRRTKPWGCLTPASSIPD